MNLREHLQPVDPGLSEVILLFASFARPINEAFRSKQGAAGTRNVFGEEQQALDKWADKYIIEHLEKCRLIRSVASEERDDVIFFDQPEGRFSVTLDPLDGSSLLDVNLTVGTIVGIFEDSSPLRKGKELAAAMYILYGPMNTVVYSAGEGVHEFVQEANGDFVLFNENIRIPTGKIMAPGGLRKDFLPYHRRFMERLEEKGFKIRFSGSFVADVHQILHKGGVFTYPALTTHPNGKLRLLFEANPMGFIVTRAGGGITTGFQDILDITPEGVEQRVPIYLGDSESMELIRKCCRENP